MTEVLEEPSGDERRLSQVDKGHIRPELAALSNSFGVCTFCSNMSVAKDCMQTASLREHATGASINMHQLHITIVCYRNTWSS